MSWNEEKDSAKGLDDRARKISQTMRDRGINNFSAWQEKAKKEGRMKSEYPDFPKNGDLAELIGVVLGDGNIHVFPRTECLLIFGDANKLAFIKRYADLVQSIFGKRPRLRKEKTQHSIRICIYQKHISSRLGVPSGARRHATIRIPGWIWKNKGFIVRYLRGLYEAEGSFCVHQPTGTYKFLFSNRNETMLRNVFRCVKKLGFHPHISNSMVQVSRKAEAYALKGLIRFRNYADEEEKEGRGNG